MANPNVSFDELIAKGSPEKVAHLLEADDWFAWAIIFAIDPFAPKEFFTLSPDNPEKIKEAFIWRLAFNFMKQDWLVNGVGNALLSPDFSFEEDTRFRLGKAIQLSAETSKRGKKTDARNTCIVLGLLRHRKVGLAIRTTDDVSNNTTRENSVGNASALLKDFGVSLTARSVQDIWDNRAEVLQKAGFPVESTQ